MERIWRTLGGGLRRGLARLRVHCGCVCDFSWVVLWVELTGGIGGVLVSRRVLDADAVLHHQPSELAGVRGLPDRIPIGLKDQFVAHGIEGDHPVCAVGVIGVTETAKEVGVIAMQGGVFVANGNGLDAVDGYFHVGGIYWIKKTIR